jgi:hypothetical protein
MAGTVQGEAPALTLNRVGVDEHPTAYQRSATPGGGVPDSRSGGGEGQSKCIPILTAAVGQSILDFSARESSILASFGGFRFAGLFTLRSRDSRLRSDRRGSGGSLPPAASVDAPTGYQGRSRSGSRYSQPLRADAVHVRPLDPDRVQHGHGVLCQVVHGVVAGRAVAFWTAAPVEDNDPAVGRERGNRVSPMLRQRAESGARKQRGPSPCVSKKIRTPAR